MAISCWPSLVARSQCRARRGNAAGGGWQIDRRRTVLALPLFELPGLVFATFGAADVINTLADDASVASIVLDVNSPGSAVAVTPELARAV
jgi:hypothetical protein